MQRSVAAAVLTFCSMLAVSPAPAAEEGKRVALVVGNNAYSVRPLQNAVNDARIMDQALRAAGFRTVVRENATKIMMEEATVAFLQALGPEDTALFFFAGHAVQIENENVLIPVDFSATSTVIEAKFKSFSLAMIFDYLKRTRVKRSVVIVDACRSNPVAEEHSLQAGLAIPLNAGKETYIAFSTSPNHVATDNPEGKNSWFTEALANLIAQPGLTIDEIFTRVRLRVEKATEGRQTPWSQTSLTTRFYFHPPANLEAENDPTVVEKWMQDALRHEQRENWAQAANLLNQVLKKKPGGTLEQAARRKLPYLAALNDAQARFDASDFGAAAALYEKALALDPFSEHAALRGIDSHLLNDQLPGAVALLKTLRVRGTSASVGKADAVLKQLAAVYPGAGEELKTGAPQPPPAEEVFADTRFGAPDWEAGRRYVRANPADLARWLKDPRLAAPAPAVVVMTESRPADQNAGGAAPAGAADAFHLELISLTKSRDLLIRQVGAGATVNTSGVQRAGGVPVKVVTDPPGAEVTLEGDAGQRCPSPCVLSVAPPKQVIQVMLEGFRPEVRVLNVGAAGETVNLTLERESGFVQLHGPDAATTLVLDGMPVSRQVPVKLHLPAGRYELRSVRQGNVESAREVQVKPGGTTEVSVEPRRP